MSSLTISTTVCDDCQPWSSSVGLNTRSRGAPGVRRERELEQRQRGAVQVGRRAGDDVLVVHAAEVLARERLGALAVGGGDAVAHQREHLGDARRGVLRDLGGHESSCGLANGR